MGKERRRRQATQIQDILEDMRSRVPQRGARYPAGDLAESFRKASKALEAATRDVAALRHRVTKPPSR
jgi:hypothetical protein